MQAFSTDGRMRRSFQKAMSGSGGDEAFSRLQATNRLAEAQPLMLRALAIVETSLGPDHHYTVGARENLAALRAQKD